MLRRKWIKCIAGKEGKGAAWGCGDECHDIVILIPLVPLEIMQVRGAAWNDYLELMSLSCRTGQ